VITQFAGQRIESVAQLKTMIASRQPSESLSVEAWRPDVENNRGENFSVRVVIEQLKPETNSKLIVDTLRSIGVKKLASSTEAMAQQFGVPFERGVLVEEVVAGSSVAGILPPGTLIMEVFGQKIANLDDFYTRINRKLRTQGAPELVLGVRQQNGDVAQLRIPLP
jgi:S1-C subfamily serine protease